MDETEEAPKTDNTKSDEQVRDEAESTLRQQLTQIAHCVHACTGCGDHACETNHKYILFLVDDISKLLTQMTTSHGNKEDV